MKTFKAQLGGMSPGSQFTHNNQLYTVTEQGPGMVEVFSEGRLWAWPTYNGIQVVRVNQLITW